MPLFELAEIEKKSYPPEPDLQQLLQIKIIEDAVADIDMKIVYDEATGTIRIGEATFSKYTNYKNAHTFGKILLAQHDIHSYSHHPKWLNKALSTLVKGSFVQTYKFFKALQYKVFVVPHKHIIRKISFAQGRVNVKALERIVANKAVLQEVYNDGLHHLLPIVAMTGKSPKELKKEFGATWKVFCKNTLNKNKAVVRATVGKLWDKNTVGNLRLVQIASLPTTVLDNFSTCSVVEMQHIAQHYRGHWKAKYVKGKSPDWSTVRYHVRDTGRMALQLGEKFDPLWSPRKMKEKHDQYSKAIHTLQYSPKPIEWLESILPCFEHNGCVATLLNSRWLVAEEGREMGHCVGSYAENVACGEYLVYSVATAIGERSTLGIRVTKDCAVGAKQVFKYDQHYRKYNYPLVEEAEKEISKMIIDKLNGEDK